MLFITFWWTMKHAFISWNAWIKIFYIGHIYQPLRIIPAIITWYLSNCILCSVTLVPYFHENDNENVLEYQQDGLFIWSRTSWSFILLVCLRLIKKYWSKKMEWPTTMHDKYPLMYKTINYACSKITLFSDTRIIPVWLLVLISCDFLQLCFKSSLQWPCFTRHQ